MEAERLLREITDYCRKTGVAESTFGRLAVNDGKFVNRLRDGGRITTTTFDRVRSFIAGGAADATPVLETPVRIAPRGSGAAPAPAAPQDRNFRFFDNRQKYLLFVSTCSEKAVVAQRVKMELANIHPRPPAVRIFDAGVGDGTVLTRVMRAMHSRFATMPFYIVGKEISLEDVRLTLEKMPDRFFEHPATVLVMTNLYYREAPWLVPSTLTAASGLAWHELALTGTTGHEFEEQITALAPFLAEHWRAHEPDERQSGLRAPGRPRDLPRGSSLPIDPIIPPPRRHRAPTTTSSWHRSLTGARAPLDFRVSA
jgi:hypothetical protein